LRLSFPTKRKEKKPGTRQGLQGHERKPLEGGKSLGSLTVIQTRESRKEKT